MAGHGDRDGQARVGLPRLEVGEQTGDAGSRGRLDEDTLAPGELGLGGEDLRVADRPETAARLVGGGLGLLPRRRVADPDRGRLRLGVGERVTRDERRRALRLEAAASGASRVVRPRAAYCS